jgi:hypothetical protein
MRPACLNTLWIFTLCFTLIPAFAQDKDYRSVEALKSLGIKQCTSTISTITKFIYDEDNFAYLNTWQKTNSDKHITLTTTAKPYSEGSSIATIAVSPTADGTCDANFVQILVVKDSCPALRDTTFKKWKYYADLGGTPVYEDPSSAAVNVTLTPANGGCLIVKSGMLSLPMGK